MTQPVYEIAKWNSVFVRAESRKLQNLNWVSVPVNFSSNGYQQMLDEFGDEAPAIYGAWIALVSFASSCPVRGVLASSRGKALPISHVARVTGFPASLFDRLFAWASGADVSWLVPVADPVRVAQNGEKHEDSSVSGETPDDLPELRGIVGGSSGESPDAPPTRQGNPPTTRQDITQPDITAAAASAAAGASPLAAAAAAAAVDVLVSVSDPAAIADPPQAPDLPAAPAPQPTPEHPAAVASGVDPFFGGLDLDAVRTVARRLATAAPTLPRDVVWRACAIGQVIDPELIPDVIRRLGKREIGKPESYLEKLLREECERLGHDYRQVKKRSPPTPPPTGRGDTAKAEPARPDPLPKPAFRRPPTPQRNVRVLDPTP